MNTLVSPVLLLAIFMGAGAGGILRYLLSTLVGRSTGMDFPYGTLAVNILGGFVLGLLVGYWSQSETSPLVRTFLVTGLLGGFTTFSAFTLENVLLIERQQTLPALAYILASVCGAILALAAGLWLARA